MTSFLLKLFLRTPLAKSGENLWEANSQDFMLSLNKRQKLLISAYLIAQDTLDGTFPPNVAESPQAAYRREIEYLDNLPGVTRDAMNQIGMSKPFWGGQRNAQAPARFHAHRKNSEKRQYSTARSHS